MIVTADVLQETYAGLKVMFDDAYNKFAETANWDLIADEIETTLATQNYAWLGRGAVMGEFKDESEEQDVNEMDYSLTDITYDASISIRRRTLEDEQYGLLRKRVDGIAQAAVRHWNKSAYVGLALGFSTLCHDGQFFFDTDHADSSGSSQYSNRGTSAFGDTALETTEIAMMSYTDDKGEPLGIVPDTLVVGPKNARAAAEITGSEVVVVKVGGGTASTGATAATPYMNYFKGKYNVIVSPDLIGTYDDYWFLLDTKREVKPIIIQTRSDVPRSVESDMLEQSAHMKEKYKVRVRERKVQGYGLPQTAFGHIL